MVNLQLSPRLDPFNGLPRVIKHGGVFEKIGHCQSACQGPLVRGRQLRQGLRLPRSLFRLAAARRPLPVRLFRVEIRESSASPAPATINTALHRSADRRSSLHAGMACPAASGRRGDGQAREDYGIVIRCPSTPSYPASQPQRPSLFWGVYRACVGGEWGGVSVSRTRPCVGFLPRLVVNVGMIYRMCLDWHRRSVGQWHLVEVIPLLHPTLDNSRVR